ncbi:S-like RNase [Klebsormidium nitens]|uniref:S-like RNase n=1 Tax=Klebsormidium nitens TaxID=105231 RepID=A0A1Y1HLM5_KLENI|nr:S-like RNase [Klebsormidium nitens]|eukprot:GAQ79520.1 S-like RNase [Klebsormidium nitens]
MEDCKTLKLLFLSLALLCASCAAVSGSGCCQCTRNCGQCTPCENEEYNYFLFVVQWPATFCLKPGSCCDGSLTASNFTIHGLWPEKSKNCYPYCCGTEPFRPSEVSGLLPELKTYWPSLACHGTDDSFHAHEWIKHGTCSLASLPDPGTGTPVREYFQRTLQLRKSLPLLSILEQAEIYPSNTASYPLTKLTHAIKTAVGTFPDVQCTGANINEVHFCLAKDLKTFIDCPTTLSTPEESQHWMKDLSRRRHRKKPHPVPHGACPAQVKLPVLHSSSDVQ